MSDPYHIRAAAEIGRRELERQEMFAGATVGLRMGRGVAPTAPGPDLLRMSVAASLTGGMIAASGKPHTAAEAVAVFRSVYGELWAKSEE